MRVAITGGQGQLGRELEGALKRTVGATRWLPLALARPAYDVTQAGVVQAIADLAPDLVIHAAAMTDVDGCARDPDAAFRVNALGTQNVALACQRAHAAMLYISTNEVFDGEKKTPYIETDQPHPINAYGTSKLEGEHFVQNLLNRFYIVRTAWLYSSASNNNFPNKIISLAREKGRLAVVADEFGNPTYAPDLARAIAQLIETNHFGIYHLVNEGIASRYDWAKRVLELAGLNIPITRMKLADYKRDSTPPRYSALANLAAARFGIKLRNWEDALQEFFNTNSFQK